MCVEACYALPCQCGPPLCVCSTGGPVLGGPIATCATVLCTVLGLHAGDFYRAQRHPGRARMYSRIWPHFVAASELRLHLRCTYACWQRSVHSSGLLSCGPSGAFAEPGQCRHCGCAIASTREGVTSPAAAQPLRSFTEGLRIFSLAACCVSTMPSTTFVPCHHLRTSG